MDTTEAGATASEVLERLLAATGRHAPATGIIRGHLSSIRRGYLWSQCP